MKKVRVIIDRNSIFQIIQDDATELMSVEHVIDSWKSSFYLNHQKLILKG